MNLQGAIESLLFVAGDEGLSLNDLELLLDVDRQQVEAALEQLSADYSGRETSGLALVQFAKRYQLVTKGVFAPVVKAFAVSPFATRLSQAALETLAIIAYKQPITRGEIDQIRGVQSTGALQKLQLRDLIEVKGRANTPGKPLLYGTSAYFMNYFGVADLGQLPDMSEFAVVDEEELQDLFNQRYAGELAGLAAAGSDEESVGEAEGPQEMED